MSFGTCVLSLSVRHRLWEDLASFPVTLPRYLPMKDQSHAASL